MNLSIAVIFRVDKSYKICEEIFGNDININGTTMGNIFLMKLKIPLREELSM